MSTHVRKLLLLLLLGIFTNYTVGWTLVVQDARSMPVLASQKVGFITLGVDRRSDINRPLRLEIQRVHAPGYMHIAFKSEIMGWCGNALAEVEMPAREIVSGTPAQDAIESVLWDQTPFEDIAHAEWTMCGWPMLSMSTHRQTPAEFLRPSGTVVGGSYVPVPNTYRPPRVYPFIPMWPGFVVNTGLWSAAWCLLIVGVPSFRAAWRHGRGGCTRCAYDLASNTTGICPECGKSTANVLPGVRSLAALIVWAQPIRRLRNVSPARVAALLVLGAITTFLSGAAASLFSPFLADAVPPVATKGDRSRDGTDRTRISHSLGQSTNDLEYSGHLLRLLNQNELPDAQSQRSMFAVFISLDDKREFEPILGRADIPRGSALVRLRVVSAGWPMHAFTSGHAFASDGEHISATHMNSVPILPRIGGSDALRAPIAPIPLGLVCDTMFWAVAWALAPATWRFIRPRRRSTPDALAVAHGLPPGIALQSANEPAR